MTFLKIVISTSKLCALTPPSPGKKSFTVLENTRRILTFLAITAILITSIVENKFYIPQGIITMIVRLLHNSTLYAFSYTIIIVLNFLKKTQWNEMVKDLVAMETTKKNNNRYEKIVFFVVHLFFFSIATYTLMNWHHAQKTHHILNVIVIYLQFLCKVLCCVILRILRVRYRHLVSGLKIFLEKIQTRGNFSQEFFRQLQWEICLLKKTTNTFNDIFGWPMALMILFSTIQLFNFIEFSVYFYENVNLIEKIVAATWILSFGMAPTVVMILMCDDVVQEARKIFPLTFQLRWAIPSGTAKEKMDLYEFSNLVLGNLPKFSAANFFYVGKPILFDIIGAAFTYVVVLIQFHTS